MSNISKVTRGALSIVLSITQNEHPFRDATMPMDTHFLNNVVGRSQNRSSGEFCN